MGCFGKRALIWVLGFGSLCCPSAAAGGLQVSFVAFSIPRCETQSCLGTRRRVSVPFEQGPDVTTQATCRKYKGVRFRADRKSWVAEMKPFKYKNKVSFGDFKSAMEAARAVDVAFYYYDKNKWRNFRDSPAFLPPLPGALNEEGKLKFVKEQARSLAFVALRLPSTWDPANRCEEYKPSSHPSSARLEQIETASDLKASGLVTGDHVKPEEILSRSSEPIEVEEIPTTSETLTQEELVSQEALDALSNSEESASLVQQLEDMISSDAQVVEESQGTANMLPGAKTEVTEFQLEPEFLDEDELWNLQIRSEDPLSCEEQKALDVNDYIDMQVPISEAEHSSVQRSIP